ncbi:MAG: hypothetical protein HFE76_04295 [Firmicutes bacterium]|nr:hypothetical protein [Bacillota bacterium]
MAGKVLSGKSGRISEGQKSVIYIGRGQVLVERRGVGAVRPPPSFP